MKANISIFTMIRNDRKDKSGRAPILIRIDLNGKPVAYDNAGERPYRIEPDFWDAQTRKVHKLHPNAALINMALAKRALEIESILMLKEAQGLELNKHRIKALVDGKDPGQCFANFCRKQIQEKYSNKETVRTYMSEVTKLESFSAGVSFADIDYAFLQRYKAWMRDDLHNKDNTIWKTFKFINTMMNDALKIGGIIDENPFGKFSRGRYEQTERTFLVKAERMRLEAVLQKDIPDDLYRVIVYELFMCYAGLRFEDAMGFDYDLHVIEDERIYMNSQKEDEQVNVKIYPKLREILAYVRTHPLKMRNQDFNALLKVAASLAGIKKNLTAHVGRHSFGRMLAETGVDIKKAQKLLAHRDERSTRVYYHMLDKDVDKEVDDKLNDV